MSEKVQLTMEGLKDMIASLVVEQVKALGLTRVDRRFGLFPSQDEVTGRSALTPERREQIAKFFRGLVLENARYNDIRTERGVIPAQWKDLSVSQVGSGGYLVPSEFHAEVIQELAKRPVLRNLVRVMAISAKDEVPTVTGKPTLSWAGENTAPAATGATFGQVVMNANLGIGYVPMSRRLVANSKVDIVRLLVELFAEVVGNGEDAVIVNGTGTNQPKGFRHGDYPVTAVVQAGATLVGDDLITLYHALPSQYRGTASWLMNDAVIQKVRKLKESTTGNYLWTPGLAGAPGTILGRPVFEANDIPTNLGSGSPAVESEIWFGDFRYYILGDAEQMSVETTTEGGEAFTKHQVLVKVWEEIDGKLAVENAFRKMTGVK